MKIFNLRNIVDISLLLNAKYFSWDQKLKIATKKLIKIHCESRENFWTIYREVFWGGDYFVPLHRKDPTIIDAGANIGISVLFFKTIWPDATIMAFEPVHENFQYLIKNTNHLPKVHLHQVALSGMDGTGSFFISQSPGGGTLMQDVAGSKGEEKTMTPTQVKTALLSSYIEGPVDLLKMDVEGAECVVIEDLVSSQKIKYIKNIVFEYHANSQNPSNKFGKLVQLLEENGFVLDCYNNDVTSEPRKYPFQFHFMVRATSMNGYNTEDN